jgi:hypothetical protein
MGRHSAHLDAREQVDSVEVFLIPFSHDKMLDITGAIASMMWGHCPHPSQL